MSRARTGFHYLLATLAACGQPPTKSGNDQVHDPNIELTALKDNKFSTMVWDPVDDYMEDLVGNVNTNPGCAIGIARGGQITYLRGYGKAQIGGESWGVGTVGAVGSVSKTFTAAGLLLLDQLGTVDITDQVEEYLGGGTDIGNVTVASLLRHTSGVGGPTKTDAFSPGWTSGSDAEDCNDDPMDALDCADVSRDLVEPRYAYDQYAASEVVETLDPNQAVYSNVAYSVAGAVIDEMTAGTLDDGYEGWIWNRIGGWPASDLDAQNMLSLALTHSWRATDIPHRAIGYNAAFAPYESWQNTAGLEGWEGPSGGWAMTIGDLTRFAIALNTSKIVNAATLADMRAPYGNLDELSDTAGMGILLPSDGPDYWHGGIIGGHTAMWSWWNNYAGASLAITMICNRNDLNPYTLRDHAVVIAGDARYTSPVTQTVFQLPPISLPNANGRSYHMDRRAAFQSTPLGATLPITELTNDLVLRATVTGGTTLSFTLHEARIAGTTAVPASGRTPTPLGPATLTNPRFTTRPTLVRLASSIGEIKVHDTVIAGSLAQQGTQLANVSLRGTVDTREVGALVGRTGADICKELATTGTSCARCSDGTNSCLPFAYERYAGRPVTMP